MLRGRIHQIWFSPDASVGPPEVYKDLSDEIRATNSHSHRHRLWSQDDALQLLREHLPGYEIFWDEMSLIQRVDFFRLVVLWVHGGWYLDMDVRVQRPLDQVEAWIARHLQPAEAYIVQTPNCTRRDQTCLGNCVLYAPAQRSDVWLEIIEEVVAQMKLAQRQWEPHHLYIMRTSGPLMLTRLLAKEASSQAHASRVAMLPKHLFNPLDLCSASNDAEKQAFMVHTNAGTWERSDSKLLKTLWCKRYSASVLCVLCCLLVVLSAIVQRNKTPSG